MKDPDPRPPGQAEPSTEPDLGLAELSSRFVQPYVRVFETLCSADGFRAAARALLREVSRATGCEAMALRVHDRKDDYPYFVYHGFDESFVEKESALCARDADGCVARNEDGVPVLECMCGLVLSGKADPRAPFFTEHGSFWTNSTTDLFSQTSDGDRGTKTRNTCNAWGYESVALVPMFSGDRVTGLIQANSRERGRFDPTVIQFLERVARHAGLAVEATWRREELDRLSREFEEHRRGLETKVALGEMAATLAHEVKNPLAGMMLSATRLRKALGQLDGQEKLVSITEHLCTSIDTLSETVTRVGRTIREPRLERAPVDVNEVLESAVSLVAPRASEQGVNVVREMAGDLPTLSADAHYLMRAFLNLIVNGLDVMPSGGILRLETGRSEKGDIQVTIADTGPGVNPDQLASFFRPFETSKPGGTGLGLGIVRRIVDLHSGKVDLRPGRLRPAPPGTDNVPGTGGGTEAVVTLPVADEGARRAPADRVIQGSGPPREVPSP